MFIFIMQNLNNLSLLFDWINNSTKRYILSIIAEEIFIYNSEPRNFPLKDESFSTSYIL
jgi:hypothetical protein